MNFLEIKVLFIASWRQTPQYARLRCFSPALFEVRTTLFKQSEPVLYLTLPTGSWHRGYLEVLLSEAFIFLLTKQLIFLHYIPLKSCILWDINVYFLKLIHNTYFLKTAIVKKIWNLNYYKLCLKVYFVYMDAKCFTMSYN